MGQSMPYKNSKLHSRSSESILTIRNIIIKQRGKLITLVILPNIQRKKNWVVTETAIINPMKCFPIKALSDRSVHSFHRVQTGCTTWRFNLLPAGTAVHRSC